MCGMHKREVVSKGTAYFRTSIKLGEESYDKFFEEQGWSPECLTFMQHLSSRYFNRAMFLLAMKNYHSKPMESEQLGLRDLQISKDMDVEVVGMLPPLCINESNFEFTSTPSYHQSYIPLHIPLKFADQFVEIVLMTDKSKQFDLMINRIDGY